MGTRRAAEVGVVLDTGRDGRARPGLAPRLGQWGVHYPRAGRGARTVHFGLIDCGKAWWDLAAEIRQCSAATFVVSAEQFIGKSSLDDWPGRVAALAEATDVDVRVVAYVRPQCQMLESLYGQKTAAGVNVKAFVEFAAEMLPSGDLDFNAMFEPWRRTFGTTAMVVTPLERSSLGGDVRSHFLGLLGAPGAWKGGPLARKNVRAGAKEIETLRMAWLALGAVSREEVRRVMRQSRRMLGSVFRNDLPVAPLTAAQARGLMARFEDANARFARGYGIDADGVLFRGPVIDGRKRPNRASWDDFAERERRLAREVVRDALGVDIAPGGNRRRRARDRTARAVRDRACDSG